MLLKRLSCLCSNCKYMIYMCTILSQFRKNNLRIVNLSQISRSNSRTFLIPSIQMSKLNSKHSSLNLIKTRIIAFVNMMIFIIRTIIAKCSHPVSHFLVICNHSTSIAESTKIFARIKTKSCRITETTCSDTLVCSTMSLSRILYNYEIMLLCKLINLRHRCRLTIQMNSHYSLCLICDFFLDSVYIDIEVIQSRLNKNRSRPHI